MHGGRARARLKRRDRPQPDPAGVALLDSFALCIADRYIAPHARRGSRVQAQWDALNCSGGCMCVRRQDCIAQHPGDAHQSIPLEKGMRCVLHCIRCTACSLRRARKWTDRTLHVSFRVCFISEAVLFGLTLHRTSAAPRFRHRLAFPRRAFFETHPPLPKYRPQTAVAFSIAQGQALPSPNVSLGAVCT